MIYDNNESQTPTFGPTDEISPVDLDGVNGIAIPMNLQPPAVFDTPVKVLIPCPGYTDVSGLNVYYYDGNNWILIMDAAGNVSDETVCEVKVVPRCKLKKKIKKILKKLREKKKRCRKR